MLFQKMRQMQGIYLLQSSFISFEQLRGKKIFERKRKKEIDCEVKPPKKIESNFDVSLFNRKLIQ
jgi:hypothetical protein